MGESRLAGPACGLTRFCTFWGDSTFARTLELWTSCSGDRRLPVDRASPGDGMCGGARSCRYAVPYLLVAGPVGVLGPL